jgi:hypothetical protein
MRTNTAESSWYEVVLASNEADAARISTSWSAAPAAVSGQDLSAWLQSLLPAVIGAAAILVPPVPKPILQEFEQPQTSQLFIRASYLATDIVPAKVADTTTVIAPARSLRTPEMKARVAEWQMSMLPYAVRDVPRQFVTDVVKALETISCNDSVACAKQSLTQIDAIASNDKCNPPDPDCIAVTNSARQWAANLARVDNQIRQVAFSSEPPKHWAVGPYAGAAKYPQSVARGEAVRVRVGGDSRLQADQFGRGVAGFIAAVALRPHQPDYWSLKNLGVHAGAIITPNIGVTVGMQWRVFRQVAIIGGPIWVWYPSGTVNSVISTSNPLKRERLQAWTFGAAFMSDAR